MTAADLLVMGQKLSAHILAQPGLSTITHDVLTGIVDEFFKSNKIKMKVDQAKIIQRSLLVLHPDKIPDRFKDQSNKFCQILLEVKNNLQSQIITEVRIQAGYKSFCQSLCDSIFQNYQVEALLKNIAKSSSPIQNWLTSNQSTLNACVKFIELVTNRKIHACSHDELLMLLLNIMVFEELVKQLFPMETPHNVIANQIGAVNFPQESLEDPLLWFMNELILDNSLVHKSFSETALLSSEKPNCASLLQFAHIYMPYPSLDIPRKILSVWSSNDYVPHIKAIIEQITESAKLQESQTTDDPFHDRVIYHNDQMRIQIDERSDSIINDLFGIVQTTLDNNSKTRVEESDKTHLNVLEDYRNLLILYAARLPIILYDSLFEITHINNTQTVSDLSIARFLQQRLVLLNFLINHERQKNEYVLEDPASQPVLDFPGQALINFPTQTGCMVTYLQKLTVRNRNIGDFSGRKLNFKLDSFPGAVNPELVAILTKAVEICKLQPSSTKDRYCKNFEKPETLTPLTTLFDNCSTELKVSYESKMLLLQFSELAIKENLIQAHKLFSDAVNENFAAATKPKELIDLHEGLHLLLNEKKQPAEFVGYKNTAKHRLFVTTNNNQPPPTVALNTCYYL